MQKGSEAAINTQLTAEKDDKLQNQISAAAQDGAWHACTQGRDFFQCLCSATFAGGALCTLQRLRGE
ncbi:MAG: hypothetical protein KTR32_30205 [Granulosicoccus sp.]|nr:hypothetical protein [Granulosicoccus sp.]